MNKDQAINQLRLRLLLLIIGLILSYIISFGLAIYFVLSTNYFKNDNGSTSVALGHNSVGASLTAMEVSV